MREDILKFFQDVTRQRGYPPFALELGIKFGLETQQAVAERDEVRRQIRSLTRTVELSQQNRRELVEAKMPSLSLPKARSKPDLARFAGRNGWPNARDRMMYWHDCAANVYVRGSVDYVFHDEQVALTPETEAWFYSADAVRLPRYVRGTRRFLEEVVEETTRGCATDRAKAMALVRLIGAPETSPYRHRDPDWKPFLGGTEEEVLRKGWRMCNEISRVLAFLCQIAGMPARCLFLFTDPLTGVATHSMTEIFFEGKWNLIEQNFGVMYLRDDGYFASAVEMRDRPEIINARCDVSDACGMCHAAFAGPFSMIPYDIDRTGRYKYDWQTNEEP